MTTGTVPDRFRSADTLALIPLWMLAGIAVVLLSHGIGRTDLALALMGALQVAFGIWVFWTHGGRQLTAAGVWSLSSSIFVGFAALWYAQSYGLDVPPSLHTATQLCYFSHVALYTVFWRYSFEPVSGAERPYALDHVTAWAGRLGFVLVASMTAVRSVTVGIVFVDAAAFAGIILLAVACAFHQGSSAQARWYLGGTVIGVVLYVSLFFTGFGRLRLATLAIALAAVAALRFKRRSAKSLLLVSVPGSLFVFGAIRVAFMQSLHPEKMDTESGGIDSVINPLLTFSQVIDGLDAQRFGYGLGESFVASAVIYVPRVLWPEKPLGFGSVLTEIILEPGSAVAGTSLAALSQGEWFHNFGILGILLMVVVLGPIIRWLDGAFRRTLTRPIRERLDVLRLAAAILAVAGMTDLVWVGTFTFNERSTSRLLALLAVALLCTDVLWRTLRTRRPSRDLPDPRRRVEIAHASCRASDV